MLLRIKLSLGIMIAALGALILFLMPLSTREALQKEVVEVVTSYQEAVEAAQQDDEKDADESNEADERGSEPLNREVLIDDEIAPYAGIVVITLTRTQFFPESRALAKVMDLRPLLAVRNRYNQVLAAHNIARVERAAAAQELARLTKLAKSAGSVARKNVTEARIALQKAEARLAGYQVDLRAVQDEAVQTWGQVITGWLLAKKSKEWQRLLSHQDSLLFVTLPVDVSLPPDVSFIKISADGLRKSARKAYFVSPAVTTDKLLQGETYFFRTATGRLRSGMRLDVWVAKSKQVLEGIFIPEQAIVWNDGHAWVYIQTGENRYQRRQLTHTLPAANGVFVQQDINEGDKLVVRGAQMLLSQEFKWQIADEDDD